MTLWQANHNRINEGYFDGATIFDWCKRVAREKGTEYIENEVISIDSKRETCHRSDP